MQLLYFICLCGHPTAENVGAFATERLQNALATFGMSVCPSVCQHVNS